ncbi:hypothetical protein MPDQ_002771 [Monascus purpureus]|uniref:Uncharacterized protein n=1 Tax=Monascus purpureus TaxID=5098 RepID=A0A507R231_MONPU|nr:hypothetical protein MPDQ_002771 [Monascus purpureus]
MNTTVASTPSGSNLGQPNDSAAAGTYMTLEHISPLKGTPARATFIRTFRDKLSIDGVLNLHLALNACLKLLYSRLRYMNCLGNDYGLRLDSLASGSMTWGQNAGEAFNP